MDKIIVTADLGNVRFYRMSEDPMAVESPRLMLLKEIDSIEGRRRPGERDSDAAGRFNRGTGGGAIGQAGSGERHGAQSETQRRALKAIATQIEDVVREEGYPRWYLAASKTINHSLVGFLSPQVRDRLKCSLHCDLTRSDKEEVLERFAKLAQA